MRTLFPNPNKIADTVGKFGTTNNYNLLKKPDTLFSADALKDVALMSSATEATEEKPA
ncbi:hypothetical protein WAI453_006041 [Rhynchosporium graminicola]